MARYMRAFRTLCNLDVLLSKSSGACCEMFPVPIHRTWASPTSHWPARTYMKRLHHSGVPLKTDTVVHSTSAGRCDGSAK